MSRDDLYRRDEQRRADMRADERRHEWRRQETLRDDRRREILRDERRQEAIRDEERRRRREADEKAQDENRKRGMSLLRDGFTDWGAAALGLDPKRTRAWPHGDPPSPGRRTSAPEPSGRPAPDKTAPERLPAPVLLRFDDFVAGTARLSWTAVPGATGYVLEESLGPSFVLPAEIYRGDRTEHVVDDGMGTTGAALRIRLPLGALRIRPSYRVKATAGPGFLDSPWSSTA